MSILYAVANGSGSTYHTEDAPHYHWFKDEKAARRFTRDSNFDPLYEGTIFRVDFGPVNDDLLCSLMTQSYQHRIDISVIKEPPLQSP